MPLTIAVGGDPKFIEDMSRALPVAGIAVAAAAGDPAALCGEAARAGCAGVLVPSDWAGEAPRFVREIVGAKVFIAGKVPREVVDSWDPFTEARTFVVPPEPHKAVLAVEKLLGVAPRAPHPDGAEEGPAPDPSADTDPLTGCRTRRAAGSLQLEGPYAVVFIDLDGFKAVNDSLGHEAGDRVLAAFGRMLLDNLKGKDTPIRWGGDEFVLVLPDTGQEGAKALAGNLAALWEGCAPDTGEHRVGFSYGVAVGSGLSDFEEAVRAADAQMYAMKERRKKDPRRAGRDAVEDGENEDTLWDSFKCGIMAAITLIEVIVVVSATVWTANQAAVMMKKELPLLSKANEAVVWFWGSLWRGLVGR